MGERRCRRGVVVKDDVVYVCTRSVCVYVTRAGDNTWFTFDLKASRATACARRHET